MGEVESLGKGDGVFEVIDHTEIEAVQRTVAYGEPRETDIPAIFFVASRSEKTFSWIQYSPVHLWAMFQLPITA